MKYVMVCYIDGNKITDYTDFSKFKRGQFICFPGTGGHIECTSDYTKAEQYDDYDMLFDSYDDFCISDMFWAVEVKSDGSLPDIALSVYEECITISGQTEIVRLDFQALF